MLLGIRGYLFNYFLYKMGKVLLSILTIISLMSGTISNGYGGEPVFTGPVRLSGPPIIATLKATLTTIIDERGEPIDFVRFWIDGICRGNPVSIYFEFPLYPLGITKEDFAHLTAENIRNTNIENTEGFILYEAGPKDCYSEYGGEPLVINTVMKFNNTGTQIAAEAVLLYVLEKNK